MNDVNTLCLRTVLTTFPHTINRPEWPILQADNIFAPCWLRLMQDYFFGTMDEYIETSYAPTGRAACRSCRAKIEKGEVRLGEIMEEDHFNSRHYYHLACFQLKPLFRNIDPRRQIYKMDQLDKDDQDKVIELIQSEVERLEGGAKGRKGSAKKGKGRPKKEEVKEKAVKKEDEEYEEKPPKRITRNSLKPAAKSKSNPKRKNQPSPSPSPSRSPSPSPKKVRGKKGSSKSTKGSAKKVKKSAAEQAYNKQQKQKMKQLRQKYMKMPVAKLKQYLALNNQTQTGTKDVLVEKCADGELLGRIPLCSHCGGGKLRFMWKCSLYQCPGYMDDDEFKNCNRYSTFAEVKREPWVHP